MSPRPPSAQRGRATSLLLAWALGALSVAGCEAFAHVDRDLIDGSGGSGGASTSSSTTTTASTGGAASCITPFDCPGDDTDCTVRTCDDGLCGTSNLPSGTPTTNQAAGDCQRAVCDGKGAEIMVADDADLPIDLDPCTDDLCTAGVPTNPPSGPAKPCAAPGGKVCDGAGSCVACVASVDCDPDLICVDNACSTCFDGARTGSETDIDCGGPCAPCALGSHCADADDCQSGVCEGSPKLCKSMSTGAGGAGGASTTTTTGSGTGGMGGHGGAMTGTGGMGGAMTGTGGMGGAMTGTGGMGGMSGTGGASPVTGSTSSSSTGGVTSSSSSSSSTASSSASSSGTTSSSTSASSSSTTSSTSASSSSSSGIVIADVAGVFMSGTVVAGTGSVRVQGHLLWHARVKEGSGSIKVNGTLRAK